MLVCHSFITQKVLSLQIKFIYNSFYMKKTVFLLLISMSFTANIFCQNIPQNISYTRIYEFVDELANEGIFEVNLAIKPYSRDFIARKLREASDNEELLNRRTCPPCPPCRQSPRCSSRRPGTVPSSNGLRPA